MVTPYERGRAFEYAVIDDLEKRGWDCIRAAGSKGAADVWAARDDGRALYHGLPTELLLIQAKASSDDLPGPAEWDTLWDLAQRTGAVAVIAWKPKPRQRAYHRLTGPKVPHARRENWPWTPWHPGPKVF